MPEENEREIKKAISIYKIDPILINNENTEEDKSIFEKVADKISNGKYFPLECEIKQNFLSEYNKKCYKLTSTNDVRWEGFVEQFTENKLQLKKQHLKNFFFIKKNNCFSIY